MSGSRLAVCRRSGWDRGITDTGGTTARNSNRRGSTKQSCNPSDRVEAKSAVQPAIWVDWQTTLHAGHPVESGQHTGSVLANDPACPQTAQPSQQAERACTQNTYSALELDTTAPCPSARCSNRQPVCRTVRATDAPHKRKHRHSDGSKEHAATAPQFRKWPPRAGFLLRPAMRGAVASIQPRRRELPHIHPWTRSVGHLPAAERPSDGPGDPTMHATRQDLP